MSTPTEPPTPAAIHHVAFACRDATATHRFYGELLGLELVHTELARHGKKGYLRHFFYDTGDGSCLAFFDLHGAGEPSPLRTAISTDLDLPVWVNHVALRSDPERMAAVERRMTEAGVEVELELDHGWCRSVYFVDPNGILVELCHDDPGMPADADQAERLMTETPATTSPNAVARMIRARGVPARPGDG